MRGVDVSVLVPTCNRPDGLRMCLAAVAQSLSLVTDAKCEVIIGNDGDPQEVQQLTEQPSGVDIFQIQGPRRGPAANRNTLAKHASGVLLVFIDDDCVPKPDLISQYLSRSRAEPYVQVFEGKIIADRPARFAYEESPVNEVGGYLWSANMAVRRTAFMDLGGFDEDFPYAAMEDVDFRARAARAAFKMRWCPEAVVCHPLEVRADWRRRLKTRYSVLLFLNKHPDRLESVRLECSARAALRQVKRRVFDRRWIQPLRAYSALADDLYSTFLMHRILRQPKTIPSEIAVLRRRLTGAS